MIKLITDVENGMIESRIYEHFTDNKRSVYDSRVTMLQNWSAAKDKKLFKLFGNQLILKKRISIKASDEAIEEIIDSSLINHLFMHKLGDRIFSLRYRLNSDKTEFSHEDYADLYLLLKFSAIRENRVPKNMELRIKSKTIKFSKDQKLMKAYKKLADAFDIPNELFEDFRLQHSLVLNDAKVTGNLCLSIHPLDYITASDNSCGWDSCLSWDDNGCHRAGTLELIECSETIVVYVESDSNKFNIDGEEWNSKKWRQFVTIADDLILSNKGYPYKHDEVSKTALEWIRELRMENLGEESEERLYNLKEEDFQSIYGRMRICIGGVAMYNDVHSNRSHCWVAMRKGVAEEDRPIEVILGKDAHCSSCGDWLDNCDTECLVCEECSGAERCSDCGDTIYSEEERWTLEDGDVVCRYCYEHNCFTCQECGEVYKDNEVNIISPENDYKYEHASEGDSYCKQCYDKLDYSEKYNKELEKVEWILGLKASDLQNLI